MLLRRVARPMMAALFIQGGIQQLKAPEGHVPVVKPVLDAVAPAVDKAVEIAPIQQRPDDVLLVKIDGGVKVVAGTLLALGKFPRLASAALAASLVPTTFAAHRFWEETDEQRKRDQQVHFLKNVGMLGGLLIAVADTEGKPSVAWRGRKAAKLASAAAASQAATVSGTASEVSGKISEVTGKLSGAAHEAGGKISGTAQGATGTLAGIAAGLAGIAPAAGAAVSSRAARTGADLSSRAEEIAADWAKRAAKARRKAEKRGAKLQKRAAKRGAELQKVATKKIAALERTFEHKNPTLLEQATRFGAEVAHQAEGAAKDVRKRAAALTH